MSEMADKDARMWAMLCHLTALSGYAIPLGNIIGPLVIWLIKKDEHPLIDENGKESINFQISATIYILVGSVVTFVLVFIIIGFFLIPVLILASLAVLVLTIIASIKAYKGEPFKYPLTIRFIS